MRKALCSLVVLLIVLTTIAGCNKQKSEVVTEPADSACSETTMAVSEEPSVEDSTAAVTESQTEEKKNFETTGTESTEPSETTTKIPTTQPTQETKPANTKPSESKPAETSKPTEQTKPTETTQPQETTKPTEPVKPVHTHSYSKATCTKPATCSCGATNGKALGHQYASATCTKAATCTVCGATNGSALGHSYSGGKCTRCGAADPNYKPPAPKFDITELVSYAKSYAQSVGLELDPEAIYCWDAPESCYASRSMDSMKKNIRDGMNWYAKQEDITAVWVWYESTGNGKYDLYIGYA